MLVLTEKDRPLPVDDYAITHKENGMDELNFELKTSMPEYREIDEETRIFETTEGIYYLVKAIDADDESVRFLCQIDLDDWKDIILGDWSGAHTQWKSGTDSAGHAARQTAYTILGWVSNSIGWTIAGDTSKAERRSISLDGPTRLEVALQLADTFGVFLRFNNRDKIVTMIYPDEAKLSNSYAVRSVNLKSIAYTGKSSDFATRIYPEGKDGLTIAGVNGGVPYIENHAWSNRIVSAYWKDERYTVASDLMADAQAKLAEMAVPARSWQCSVVDLMRIDPGRWPDMPLNLFTVLRIVDDRKGESLAAQVVEDTVYPYYPQRNSITISTVSGTVQRTLAAVVRAINNRNSTFWQTLNER